MEHQIKMQINVRHDDCLIEIDLGDDKGLFSLALPDTDTEVELVRMLEWVVNTVIKQMREQFYKTVDHRLDSVEERLDILEADLG